MAKIEIRCPICAEWKNLEIADDATKNISKGVLAINITAGMVCEHSFIVYIDKNFDVRNCLVADFKIELQERRPNEETEALISPETDVIKFDLIKLNISEILMAYMIRATFLGKKTILISDQEILFNQFKNFFRYIFENSFEFDIEFISEDKYKRNKEQYKEYLIFRKNEIIRDKNKIIDPKKLDIERAIIQKFTTEYDLMAGLIILKNEINKIYELSKKVAEIIENYKGKPITAKMLIKNISELYGKKLQVSYLSYLIEIIRNYFKVKVPKIDGVSRFLGFL